MSLRRHLRHVLSYPMIGPDMYLTHWMLYAWPFRRWLGKRMLRRIGESSEIRPFAVIDGTRNVEIGENVTIPSGVRLVADPADPTALIIIEDGVLFAPNVAVYCCTHTWEDPTLPIKAQPFKNATTIIKQGAWLGINSVIMPGVTVGRNSIVGANSLVKSDVPDYTIVGGTPARVIGQTGQRSIRPSP